MSDPLLTTLCSICHSEPPKYKCPRCGARTCSLACVRKHKSWASCSGERDPAAFVPRPQLRTDSGIDHDYNFISKIERARQRFEKEVTDGKNSLFSERELRGPRGGEDRRFEKVWYGDQLHHVPVAAAAAARGDGFRRRRGQGRPGDEGRFLSGLEKQVRRRLRAHDIEVISVPKGLSRQKQNKTAWNRRTNTINWQVEWIIRSHTCSFSTADPTEDGDVRILHKTLDENPLYKAFAGTLDWHAAGVKRAHELDNREGEIGDELPPNKRRRTGRRKQYQPGGDAVPGAVQDLETTWEASEYSLQDSRSGQWSRVSTLGAAPGTAEEREMALSKLQFLLLKPNPSGDGLKHLIPLSSFESLLSALSGRTVIEFPSIYVFDADTTPPAGFTLASTERRPPKAQEEPTESGDDASNPTHRRGGSSAGRRGGRARQPARPETVNPDTGAERLEEGEIDSENEPLGAGIDHAADLGDGTSSSSSSDGEESLEPSAPNTQQGLVDYDSSSD